MSEANIFYAPWPVKLPEASPQEPEPVWELAMLQPRQGQWTIDQYMELTDSANWPIEFHRGRLEFLAMPSPGHQYIIIFLMDALRAVVEPELGRVLMCGIRVETVEDSVREPDLAFLRKENSGKETSRLWEGADLAVEVVSPDRKSRDRDYVEKRVEYAKARIAEYWIVDPQDEMITVLTLPKGADEYAEHGVFKPGQSAGSKLLEGFSVDVRACFDAAKQG